ncbi:MAG: 2Fe-2S iron-sulfur cluster-binding protein [Acidimicrobiales bacterium]
MSNRPEIRNGSAGVFKVRIRRSNPAVGEEPYWQMYEVPRDKVARLLDVLEYIHAHLDPTLACRRHYCRDLVCNVCFINYQNKPRMSCMTPLNETIAEDEIVLEPQSGYRVIRDLVVDFLDKID